MRRISRLGVLNWMKLILSYYVFLVVDIWRTGYGSESEADDEAATVTLGADLGRVNRASTKSAVKLQELGPRMTLQLVKIEEGLCSGGVIFSEYGTSTPHLCFLLFFFFWLRSSEKYTRNNAPQNVLRPSFCYLDATLIMIVMISKIISLLFFF